MKPEAITKIINGKKYQYYDSKKGDVALVMLHGMGINKDYMIPMYQRFCKKFRCIALDLPGHNGLDLCGVKNYTDYASYIHSLISETVSSNYILLGFSLGGLVTSKYIEKYKTDKRLIRAVVWGSPVIGLRKGTTFKGKLVVNFVRYIPAVLYSFFQKKPRFKWLVRISGVQLNDVELNGLSEYERKYAIPTIDLLKTETFIFMSGVRQLYVYGSGDDFISVANCEYVKSLGLKNCETVLVESGGHLGKMGGWNKVEDRISEFLLYDTVSDYSCKLSF